MELSTLWFVIIAILWAGFFFLEGFDFGVGILAITLTRDEDERSQALAAIGPVWDADEVWLITAVAAIFAAFPAWYAGLLSAAYLPMLVLIIALVIRALSVEYRLKRTGQQWRRRWDIGIALASSVLPFGFGLLWAGLLHGLPIDQRGSLASLDGLELISAYSILGGLAVLAFSLAHGAGFLALKTLDPIRSRATAWAARLQVFAAITMAAFAVWTGLQFGRGDRWVFVAGAITVLALVLSLLATLRHRHGLAFGLNGLSILGYVALVFIALAPNAIPSSIDPAADLTLASAAAADYPLGVMTVILIVAFPVVLAYQGWSFWVFRKRIAAPVRG